MKMLKSALLAAALMSVAGAARAESPLPLPMAASPEEVGLSSVQLKRLEATFRRERPDQPCDLEGCWALEGHDGEADDVRPELPEQPLDRPVDVRLDEDEIRDRHAMVAIDIGRQGCQSTVRHPDGNRRHVLERVRHG